MIAELFRAAFFAGLPVGIVSFLLVWWAIRSKYLEPASDLKQLEKGVSQLSKARSKKKDRADNGSRPVKLNPVHNKWLKFGGGFYGVVALMTFVIVELGEITSFFGDFSENMGRLSKLNLDLIINFFIDSLMNFVTAIAWPKYWIDRIDMNHIWVWFLAAYGGYWLGARMAIGWRYSEGAEI
ncbi:MAG TPA: hypothetical protein VJ984_09605 [Xanthomonadales bacterium]|nr:hypothetical protein [Xanthomonadales bacterium]